MHRALRHRLMSLWRRFNKDESGIALIYVTVALPVIIGFSLLAIDVGRLSTLQSTLQHGADALALAGAGELDRTPDAITRSNYAINNLITTNKSLFATTVATINGASVPDANRCYLANTGSAHGLPPSDATPITDCLPRGTAAEIIASSKVARYVSVTLTPQSFNTIFPVTFIGGGSNSASASANAVAGRDQASCVYTPMFMCNPLEQPGNTDVYKVSELVAHVSSRATMRRLIELKKHAGGTAQWSPGNFGFLSVPLGNGANALGEAIASGYPSSCLIQNTVSTKPGNTTVANDAFNVRFDVYKGQYKNDNPNYWPAQNGRKTYKPGNGKASSCNIDPVSPTTIHTWSYGMPRDACSMTNTCTLGNGRMGGGDWNGEFTAYMNFNYNNAGIARPTDVDGSAFQTSNLPSRYEVYLAEIRAGLTGTPPSYAKPACYSGTAAPTNSPDRRLLYTAILNCVAQPVGSGATSGLVPVAYGKFFVTEPMATAGASLWTELVGLEVPGTDNGIYPELVQLYR